MSHIMYMASNWNIDVVISHETTNIYHVVHSDYRPLSKICTHLNVTIFGNGNERTFWLQQTSHLMYKLLNRFVQVESILLPLAQFKLLVMNDPT